MRGFLGEPTRLFMKPEKPDFFRRTEDILGSLASSENRLADSVRVKGTFSLRGSAPDEKLADWRRLGGCDGGGGGMVAAASGEVREGRGGAGRRGTSCDGVGDLVASMRLRIAVPSKGAPSSSSEVLEFSGVVDSGWGSCWGAARGCGGGGCGCDCCCCWVEVEAINSFAGGMGDRFADEEEAVGDLARGALGARLRLVELFWLWRDRASKRPSTLAELE